MRTSRVLAFAHATVCALVGAYGLVAIPVVVLTGEAWSAVALGCVAAAAVAAGIGAVRAHRGAFRVASLLHAAAALLLLGQEALPPAALAALLFAGSVALALRMPSRDGEGLPAEGRPPQA